jgi:hypothetical protein
MSSPAKRPFMNPALHHHHALTLEAATHAGRVLPLFEHASPCDSCPHYAVAMLRAYVQELASMQA